MRLNLVGLRGLLGLEAPGVELVELIDVSTTFEVLFEDLVAIIHVERYTDGIKQHDDSNGTADNVNQKLSGQTC